MKIMSAPTHVGTGLDFVASKSPDITFLTEMDAGRRDRIEAARKTFGDNYTVYAKDLGQHSQENPIVMRHRPWRSCIDFHVYPLSKDIPDPNGLGNDRWLYYLRIKNWRHIYDFYNVHTKAGVQDITGPHPTYEINNNARWKASIEDWKVIERHVHRSIADETVDGVALGSDLNVMPRGEGLTNLYSPHQVFRRLGMRYVSDRVVYLAYWGLLATQATTAFPPGQDGWPSDHAALLGNFKRDRTAVRP